ncbi:hypothetical protein SIL87_02010 [Acidiphilium acidophilum]|uniref:Uncharacterized protein n=1 Tax=Acidiphilium acidophilum TaxID=76588 RepID=A0AAW9DL07_ACIAO|nr:hypothetical protein [Acidiphilium acidophilum]
MILGQYETLIYFFGIGIFPVAVAGLIDPLILIPQLSFEENREGRVGFSEGIGIG